MPGRIQVILKSSRLPFLALSLVSIAFAASSVLFFAEARNLYQMAPDFSLLPWLFAGALSAHLSVNLFNEYWDFKSGLDFNTQRTPFSGGSGALPEQPFALRSVLWAAIICLLLTAFIGIWLLLLAYQRFGALNIELLLIGCLGLALVVIYTGPLNRQPLLCWSAPGLGFGGLMLYGTETVLTGNLSLAMLPGVLIVFVLSSNLLLLNQLPDIDADQAVGRRHLWIVKGEAYALNIYLIATCLIPLIIFIGIVYAHWPLLSLIALLPWCLTLFAWRGARRYRKKIAQHPAYLAMNVLACLLVPLILSVVLFVG